MTGGRPAPAALRATDPVSVREQRAVRCPGPAGAPSVQPCPGEPEAACAALADDRLSALGDLRDFAEPYAVPVRGQKRRIAELLDPVGLLGPNGAGSGSASRGTRAA
ncbi:hypothetical protein ACFUGD_11065 [Streptomyces sp. NPDC057217]|uniref:hypothetical protein n=1 Tax=Streptomyces sp. NPDC057217 TaxID=3346054 RepID=UPI0036322BE7